MIEGNRHSLRPQTSYKVGSKVLNYGHSLVVIVNNVENYGQRGREPLKHK